MRGLSQEQLAFESGMARRSLSDIELGKGNPTLHSLDRLASALEVPVHELLLPPVPQAPPPQPLRAGRKSR